MINRIIIVQHSFELTTPKTQRVLAAAKAYNDIGLKVVFIISLKKEVERELLPSLFEYEIIEEFGINPFKCYLSFYKAIRNCYDNNSIILFYGVPYYSFLFRSPKYHVFSEITEIPFYGRKASIKDILLNSLNEYALKKIDGLLVISKSLKTYYSSIVKKIEVINMFVDSSRFAGIKKQTTEKYVGYCGTLSVQKDGVNVLINAFNLFLREHPDYKLYLFGDFENEEVRNTLLELVNKLELKDKVIFTGPVKSDEMPQKLYDAEILALARPDNKQAQYGFPTKLGEYLATGNPIVITSVGEIPLFLKDDENAFLSPPDDHVAFASKLCWVADNIEMARIISAKGKELIDTEFSSSKQTIKALRFMESVIGA